MPEYIYHHDAGPESDVAHTITAHEDGKRIGHMHWHPEIEDIYVDPEHRRKGIATEMWNRAKHLSSQFSDILPPEHSPFRTYAGEMWAGAVSNYDETMPDWEPIEQDRT